MAHGETTHLLEQIYNDPKGGLGGVESFREAARAKGVKLTRGAAARFLASQDAYTLHKPSRIHFTRNPTIVGHVDDQWQADLCDLTKIAQFNGGYRYLLTVIDCFSRFAWIEPVKRKDGPAVTAAFERILERASPRKPLKLQTDKGLEFYNSNFRGLLNKYKTELFSTENYTIKAAMVERFNRTIKTRLWVYFTAHNTKRWLEPIVDICESYNSNKHRSLHGHSPKEVVGNKKLQDWLWERVYVPKISGGTGTPDKKQFSTPVRVSKYRGIFEKGYTPRWSGELYKVEPSAPMRKAGEPLYKLKDWAGLPLAETFYKKELQPVQVNPKTTWQVEKVIRKRQNPESGETEYLVKWRRWGEKYSRWLTEQQLAEYKEAKK